MNYNSSPQIFHSKKIVIIVNTNNNENNTHTIMITIIMITIIIMIIKIKNSLEVIKQALKEFNRLPLTQSPLFAQVDTTIT